MRINTLPDIVDIPSCFGPDYETPKFNTGVTNRVGPNALLKKDDFFSFGFNKKLRTPI